MNIKDEFAYADDYFNSITKEDLINALVDCGLQICEHCNEKVLVKRLPE